MQDQGQKNTSYTLATCANSLNTKDMFQITYFSYNKNTYYIRDYSESREDLSKISINLATFALINNTKTEALFDRIPCI